MRCPYCRHPDNRVVDSRDVEDGKQIRRRRICLNCDKRFNTFEEFILEVSKRSGTTEPFDRSRVAQGVMKACQGRPVNSDDVAKLAQAVEDEIRSRGVAVVTSHDVGLAILNPLKELDVVAYLRFASVYRSFESIEDFEAEIAHLRESSQSSEE